MCWTAVLSTSVLDAPPLWWLKPVLVVFPCWTAYRCHGACAEVDSDTEAVAGKGFKLGCISCKKRSEVDSSATVEWYFRPKGEADFFHVSLKPGVVVSCLRSRGSRKHPMGDAGVPLNQIYTYNNGPTIEHEQFLERIDWNGSKRSNDIQDASIYLLNVTFNDTGTYRCFFNRALFYTKYEYNTVVSKVVHLTVVAKGRSAAAQNMVLVLVLVVGSFLVPSVQPPEKLLPSCPR